ncbi:hypothetical protein [Sphingopyxis fribergensis]
MFTTVKKTFVVTRWVCPDHSPTIDQQIDPMVKTTKPQPVMRAPRFEAVIIAAIMVAMAAIKPAVSSSVPLLSGSRTA